MPQMPPSRARPDALTPPKGDPAARAFPFISTMPDRSTRARRFRRGPSEVCTCGIGANQQSKSNGKRVPKFAPHVVCEAIGRVVCDANSVRFVVKRHHAQHRPKDFLFFNRHSRFHVGKDSGANEVAFGHAVGKSKATSKQLRPLVNARLNVALHLLN